MSGGILSRWPVVLEVAVAAHDLDGAGHPSEAALGRWFDGALDAYLGRCPPLAADLAGGLRLDAGPLRAGRVGALAAGGTATIALAMPEVRPSSFEAALRIRAGDGTVVLDGRRTLRLLDPAGSPLPVSAALRRALIATELAAADYC